MTISKDAIARLKKGAEDCAHYAGYEAERKHCPCGIDYTIIKVNCDRARREVRANNCNEACPHYIKEK